MEKSSQKTQQWVTLGEMIANASPHHRLDYEVWAQYTTSTTTQPPPPQSLLQPKSTDAIRGNMAMKAPRNDDIKKSESRDVDEEDEEEDANVIQVQQRRRAIQLAPSRYTTKLATYRMSIVESSASATTTATAAGSSRNISSLSTTNRTSTSNSSNISVALNPWNVGVVATIQSNGTIVILSPSGKVSKSNGQEKQLLRRIKKHTNNKHRRSSSSSFSTHLWIDYGNIDDMNLPLGWLPHNNNNDGSDDDLDPSSRTLSLVASEDTMATASTQDEKHEDIVYDSECNGYLTEDGYFLGKAPLFFYLLFFVAIGSCVLLIQSFAPTSCSYVSVPCRRSGSHLRQRRGH